MEDSDDQSWYDPPLKKIITPGWKGIVRLRLSSGISGILEKLPSFFALPFPPSVFDLVYSYSISFFRMLRISSDSPRSGFSFFCLSKRRLYLFFKAFSVRPSN